MTGRACAGSTVPEDVLAVARRVAGIVRHVTADSDYRVLLFGSWASGRAVERSDIDIGILGPSEVDPGAMVEIREACEGLPTLHAVDLVDLAGVAADLRRVAVAEGLEVEPV
jgi:predicted nucleotidyltransferase